jgi:hypothetical protein
MPTGLNQPHAWEDYQPFPAAGEALPSTIRSSYTFNPHVKPHESPTSSLLLTKYTNLHTMPSDKILSVDMITQLYLASGGESVRRFAHRGRSTGSGGWNTGFADGSVKFVASPEAVDILTSSGNADDRHINGLEAIEKAR